MAVKAQIAQKWLLFLCRIYKKHFKRMLNVYIVQNVIECYNLYKNKRLRNKSVVQDAKK